MWHGRDDVTLADERARKRGTPTSTYTGAPVFDPTWERQTSGRPDKLRPSGHSAARLAYPRKPTFSRASCWFLECQNRDITPIG
jgi:hypothetical protein